MLRDWRSAVALGFGSGLSPVAPGTVGTLAAVPLFLLLAPLPPWAYAATVVLLFLGGVPVCTHAAARLGQTDPKAVVWDEVVGFLIAMAGAPVSVPSVIAGFLLFRLFDILKPGPVRWLERRLAGGLGIMADDAAAGLLAAAAQGLWWNGWLPGQ